MNRRLFLQGLIASAGATSRVGRSIALVAAPVLSDLKGVAELIALFNRDAEKHRLVLLLSPT